MHGAESPFMVQSRGFRSGRNRMVIRETDIRPADLEAGKLDALNADLERLAARKYEFVAVACPACGADDGIFEFEKYGFTFDKCPHCGTAYMNPRATPEILADFYGKSVLYEYWNRHIFPASRAVRMERIFRPRVRRILDLCREWDMSPGVLVEVGSAAGMFCEEAQACGTFKRIIGIEPSAAQAATCRSMGIEIIEATLEQIDGLDTPADIVASFETIEHVYSPMDFIRRCHGLLSPGGLLVLTCPNYEGFDIMTLGVLSDSLDAEHINMFNPSALGRLVESLGFEVLEISTPGELDAELVRNKVLDGSFCLDDQHFLRKILIDDWTTRGRSFQDYLKAQRLSSHMWLAARKKD